MKRNRIRTILVLLMMTAALAIGCKGPGSSGAGSAVPASGAPASASPAASNGY